MFDTEALLEEDELNPETNDTTLEETTYNLTRVIQNFGSIDENGDLLQSDEDSENEPADSDNESEDDIGKTFRCIKCEIKF